MNKENKLIADFDFQLVINFFAGLNSQGPGGEKETLKALSFLENTSSQIKIADIGKSVLSGLTINESITEYLISSIAVLGIVID